MTIEVKSTCLGIGDLISCTPALRKLSKLVNSKINVYSYKPEILKNLSYIENSLLLNSDNYNFIDRDLYNTENRDDIEFKDIPLFHNMSDIRQFPANTLGFQLTPDELHCDYIPSEPNELNKYNLPDNYIVIHAELGSWSIKNWSEHKWQELCDKLNLPIIQVGKRKTKPHNGPPMSYIPAKLNNVINLSNKISLDQTWHLCNNAKHVITTDSGILHLAGTTDTNIIYIAMGRHPYFTGPYRKGSQNYKCKIIENNCNWCMSNKMKEFIPVCSYEIKSCEPSVDQVLEAING